VGNPALAGHGNNTSVSIKETVKAGMGLFLGFIFFLVFRCQIAADDFADQVRNIRRRIGFAEIIIKKESKLKFL
jgi:hypothetical protein